MFPHSEHTWAFTPVCIFRASSNIPAWKKSSRKKSTGTTSHPRGVLSVFFSCNAEIFFSTLMQSNGRSSEWECWWIRRYTAFVKRFPHWRHTKGFSPEWMRRWFFKMSLRVKLFHTEGTWTTARPVWIRMWSLRVPLQKLFPHCKQTKGRSQQSEFWCGCSAGLFVWISVRTVGTHTAFLRCEFGRDS